MNLSTVKKTIARKEPDGRVLRHDMKLEPPTPRFSAPIPGRNPDETVVIELEPGARIIVDVVDLSGVSVEGARAGCRY